MSPDQFDSELGRQFRAAVQAGLGRWEFTAAMREAVMGRLARPVMAAAAQPRAPIGFWQRWRAFSALAVAAAVLVFVVINIGQQHVDGPELGAAPAARVMLAPAPAAQSAADVTIMAAPAAGGQPSLVIDTEGGLAPAGRAPAESAAARPIRVALHAYGDEAWPGPIQIEAWIDFADGTRVSIGTQTYPDGLTAGGELTCEFAWDGTTAAGAAAAPGEYTVQARAHSSGGQTVMGWATVNLMR